MTILPDPTDKSPANETVGLGAYLVQQGITLPEIAERGNEFMICYRVAHKQEHGKDPGGTVRDRQIAAQVIEQMWPGRTCSEYCAGEPDCSPAERVHIATPAVATTGGPLADSNATMGASDITAGVGLDRSGDDPTITLNIRYLERDAHNWYAPLAVNGLLPTVGMNSERARHLSRLLDGAADEFDRIARGRK